MNLWKTSAHITDKLFVILNTKLRVMTSLHEDLRPANCNELLDFFEDLFGGPQISLFHIAGLAVERAEFAIGVADVRVIDIAVHEERGAMLGLGILPQVELIGHHT